jgi:hypothetical protein
VATLARASGFPLSLPFHGSGTRVARTRVPHTHTLGANTRLHAAARVPRTFTYPLHIGMSASTSTGVARAATTCRTSGQGTRANPSSLQADRFTVHTYGPLPMCGSLTAYTHLELDTPTDYVFERERENYVCVVHNNTCWCGGKVRAVVCAFLPNIHRAASPLSAPDSVASGGGVHGSSSVVWPIRFVTSRPDAASLRATQPSWQQCTFHSHRERHSTAREVAVQPRK